MDSEAQADEGFVCYDCGDYFADDEGDGDYCADCLDEQERSNEL